MLRRLIILFYLRLILNNFETYYEIKINDTEMC